MVQKLNERREHILRYKSIYGPYYIYDLYRTASKKELHDILVQTEEKLNQMNQDFFSLKYNRDYLTAEIEQLKYSIVKIDFGQCKSDDNVSTAGSASDKGKLFYLGFY